MPKHPPKKAKITPLAKGEPCVVHIEEFQAWSPQPLRVKMESFRRQAQEWGLAANVIVAENLPVKQWFSNSQQKQIWNQMKVAIGKTEDGKKR